MNRIRFTIGKTIIDAELLETPTARAVAQNLPFASKAQTWGHDIYFETPVEADIEADAKDVIEAGEIAFWVQCNCIAIGFGTTPGSQGDEIRLSAKSNVFARALTDVTQLKSVKPDDFVFVELIST
ncbi:MAG: hypothetical protein EP315_06600 [Gammaproteobacteria bacterium]|nr:MAG: hypothetical protein EP315_06600 [Gammaproteobacteria bacterium]